jgi:hypothetical protein
VDWAWCFYSIINKNGSVELTCFTQADSNTFNYTDDFTMNIRLRVEEIIKCLVKIDNRVL